MDILESITENVSPARKLLASEKHSCHVEYLFVFLFFPFSSLKNLQLKNWKTFTFHILANKNILQTCNIFGIAGIESNKTAQKSIYATFDSYSFHYQLKIITKLNSHTYNYILIIFSFEYLSINIYFTQNLACQQIFLCLHFECQQSNSQHSSSDGT